MRGSMDNGGDFPLEPIERDTAAPLQLALSIVAPHGLSIASGRKTIEVRSWRPDHLPLRNLLIVENDSFLTEENQADPNGRAVALVDIEDVHAWEPSELAAACSNRWAPGYWAWRIANVRPLAVIAPVVARRRLYRVETNPEFLNRPVS
jgi:hypothetical protein